jgi:membrane associated rhomboid family serine protease
MIPFRDNIPSRRYPAVTVLIIAVNVAVFIYQLFLPPRALEAFIFHYGFVPARLELTAQYPLAVMRVTVVSLFASMFLHGGWLHLIGNMWYLWIFGDNVEDRMGHFRFLIFYLLCGLAASLVQLIFNFGSSVPSIGASGAIAGVLGAYLLSYPFARILTLVPFLIIWPIVELPAILVLGFWFVLQIFYGVVTAGAGAQAGGGVAWWAHVGGFVAGMLLLAVFAERRRPRYTWREEEV